MRTEWQSSDALLGFPGTFSARRRRSCVCLYRVNQSFPHAAKQRLESSHLAVKTSFNISFPCWEEASDLMLLNGSVPLPSHGSPANKSIQSSCLKWPEEWDDSDMVKYAAPQVLLKIQKLQSCLTSVYTLPYHRSFRGASVLGFLIHHLFSEFSFIHY